MRASVFCALLGLALLTRAGPSDPEEDGHKVFEDEEYDWKIEMVVDDEDVGAGHTDEFYYDQVLCRAVHNQHLPLAMPPCQLS